MKKLFCLAFLLLIFTGCQPSQPAPTAISTPEPTSTATDQDLTGHALNGGTAPTYRLMEDGSIRHISSWLSLFAYGYIPQEVITIPMDRLKGYPLSKPLTEWVTGVSDHRLYYLQYGKRYLIHTLKELSLTGGDISSVSVLPDELLTLYPLVSDQIPPYLDNQSYSAPAQTENISIVDSIGVQWAVERAHYDFEQQLMITGGGLRKQQGNDVTPISFDISLTRGDDPTSMATVLLADPNGKSIWVGTSYAGLLRYNIAQNTWRVFNIFNSDLPDNTITALAYSPEGILWVSTPSGIASFKQNKFTFRPIDETPGGNPGLAMAVTADNRIWLAGRNTIAELLPDGTQHTWDVFGYPALRDTFESIVLDADGAPTITGQRLTLHYDGARWSAVERSTGSQVEIKPVGETLADSRVSVNFPLPTSDPIHWLQRWPRPVEDNGRCLHYLQLPSGEEFEVRQNIARLQALHVRWALVNYTDRAQLVQMAPLFQQAGIMVVWRPFVRPYETYPYWSADVMFLRSQGIAPYIQVYNEPSLAQEWDGAPVDQEAYLNNLIPAIQAVYDAGGFVGIQEIEPAWLAEDIKRIKQDGDVEIFSRLFFVPHPYGLNHPPDYTQDINSVLGFREYARIFTEQVGFVPPMIAGEGGWRPGEAQDNRYPMVDAQLHSQYITALFDWFRLGKLSDGEPLPDYLFAFCPWLLSDPVDPAAWYDSRSGDLTQTIDAVAALPPFERRFSWDR